MHECDPQTAPSNSGLFIDESCALGLQVAQCCLYRRHSKSDVMQPFAMAFEKASDGRSPAERLNQLDERAADRDHRFFDALGLDHLAIQRFNPIPNRIALQGRVEIGDGYGNVVEVDQLHLGEAIGRRLDCHASQLPSRAQEVL